MAVLLYRGEILLGDLLGGGAVIGGGVAMIGFGVALLLRGGTLARLRSWVGSLTREPAATDAKQ